MNNKGQALVEFIIIIPVVILIFLAILDYTRIILLRSSLEDTIEEVIDNKDFPLEEDITLKETVEDNKKKIYLQKNITLYSPFLNAFMDNPYEVEVQRVVYE